MSKTRYLSFFGSVLFASASFAQYTMNLTGVGDGASIDGVYVGPYQGTISVGADQIYSGYMICDDFTTESYLGEVWSATATNAGSVAGGTEKFTSSITGYTVQQNYNAAAWLANQLVMSSNVTNPAAQIDYSFAIWDIFDGAGATSDPTGGASAALIQQAFYEVTTQGYVGSDVTVYTASPDPGISQEMLVVNAPEPPSVAVLAIDLAGVLGMVLLGRKRWMQAHAKNPQAQA